MNHSHFPHNKVSDRKTFHSLVIFQFEVKFELDVSVRLRTTLIDFYTVYCDWIINFIEVTLKIV